MLIIVISTFLFSSFQYLTNYKNMSSDSSDSESLIELSISDFTDSSHSTDSESENNDASE